ncbi:hypothetical protein A33Q_2591 [Indibacter alkaliphilus LW1]|uniref:GxxExxY protein n=1 Tax=Indibacter alkaliphilus (strain CCUG 57479 / KCTC 22604 / LW1) TaxID=1189612 RepID=S2E1P9_INDAL|nr:GxxExxY protein [Indibacter alkaliphilus]EOZ95998.1 hypothetical protein A33Q_2591 [Indibacter alkaliphilus LW1]
MIYENDISYEIRGAIYSVYNNIGPGLLESIYESALDYELKKLGLKTKRQVVLPFHYCGDQLGSFRLDLLVNDKVIVEVKSVAELLPVHHKQLISYLKLSNFRLGILVNFNVNNINEGIFRKVNGL